MPVTFAADITGPRGNSYALVVGRKTFTSTSDYIRVTPAELLAAVGHPLKSASNRTVKVTYQVRQHGRVVARASDTLTIGPWNGISSVAPAPVVRQVVASGQSVTVSYHLAGCARRAWSARGAARPTAGTATTPWTSARSGRPWRP